MSQTQLTGSIQVHRADPGRWEDVATVMGRRGGAAFCWCQFFRLRGRQWSDSTPETNREALREQVCEGAAPPGLVAYLDGEPVGWCGVAPKRDYPRVVASKITGPDLDRVWAVTCFVVRVGYRRRGIARALVSAAVEFARQEGAAVVEGYPVDPARRTSVSADELYHGTFGLFAGAGFAVVSRPSKGRVLMRRSLDPVDPVDPLQ